MNNRLGKFAFGSRRKSNLAVVTTSVNRSPSTPPAANSSVTSLQPQQPPMNQPANGLGRPPSYSYGPNAGRPHTPQVPGQTQAAQHPHPGHPPPIDTRQQYPGTNPNMGAPQPPGYGGTYGQPQPPMQQPLGNYGPLRPVEVPGQAANKAQLIVGIDFVRGIPEVEIITVLSQ